MPIKVKTIKSSKLSVDDLVEDKKDKVSTSGSDRSTRLIQSGSASDPTADRDLGEEKSTPVKVSAENRTSYPKAANVKLSSINAEVKAVPVNRVANYYNNGYRTFDGVVDNRVLPDAGVPMETVEGFLDLEQNGHGILRPKFTPSDKDIYISASQIRRFSLRPGDKISGPARQPKDNERYWGLLKVEKVNDLSIEEFKPRQKFDALTPMYPNFHIKLEHGQDPLATRIIDLVAPIGKGQRGLIVSPPKAGKTTILKQIANGITANYPKIHLMAVLVGERPEEVTDIKHSVKGEVVASNFDDPPEKQTKSAEIALERAKRLAEMGIDVVILLDSITRLARAYNLAMPTSGRTLTGGFDPAALYPAKKFLGAARNFEEGGSLTIIGTALVDTGSRMDELIYEEFKGTGNMELHLNRSLEERRIFPAIDVQKSGTRKEEMLMDDKTYAKIVTMRRMIDVLGRDERTELLLERLKKTKNNKEFLDALGKG